MGSYIKCKTDLTLNYELTVMEYIQAPDGILIAQEADMVLGSSTGALLLLIEGRLLSHVSEAHTGPVLCVCRASYEGAVIILTGGQDGYIRIWDSGLCPINNFEVSTLTSHLISPHKSHSIANLSVYSCELSRSIDKTLPKSYSQALVVLIGTSGGVMAEVNLSHLKDNDKMQLKYDVYFESHCGAEGASSKTLLAVHSEESLFASVAQDGVLKFWDYRHSTLLFSAPLERGFEATALAFSSFGFFAVGSASGSFQVFNCPRIEQSECKLETVFTASAGRAAVIDIQFSLDGRWLALSCDRSRENIQLEEKFVKMRGGRMTTEGFVLVYALVGSAETATYEESVRINFPFSHIRDIGRYPSRSECAVVGMEFSLDSNFLGFFHQRVSYKRHLPSGFDYNPILMVWDLTKGHLLGELEDSLPED